MKLLLIYTFEEFSLIYCIDHQFDYIKCDFAHIFHTWIYIYIGKNNVVDIVIQILTMLPRPKSNHGKQSFRGAFLHVFFTDKHLSLNFSNTGVFLFHTRSSGTSSATERIREDSGRGGAYSDELGEYLHGNQGLRDMKKGHKPPSTSSSCIYSIMLLCKPESLSSASVCLYSYMNSCEQHSPPPSVHFPCLESYVTYCCNQVGAKALLDQKKHEKRVEHFLRLCQESSVSRKLDLWNFLDLPRSRLVKYPLLLKEIQKCTPPEHPDEDSLPDAVS